VAVGGAGAATLDASAPSFPKVLNALNI
jgi:hypothetical protein